jgi:hypothetical protein
MSRSGRRATGVRPTTARIAVLALVFALAGCGGGRDATGPDPEPPGEEPGTPAPAPGVQGSYVLAQINASKPGQLVTIANPDGLVIGLYRFEATTMTLDPLQRFELALRFTDDKTPFAIDDAGEFKQAGPISQEGALPLTFYSDVYGDQFTGVVLNSVVAIKYDFDGDGQLDTSFGFRRID